MKKRYRVISAAILAAMLTSIACSCGQDGSSKDTNESTDGVNDTVDTTPEVETSPLYSMEKQDFGGREFRISTSEDYEDEMWVESENGDVCNDAVYRRNKKVEEYFNVKIKTIPTLNIWNDPQQVNAIRQSCMSGDDVYDLVAVYTFQAGGPVLEGFYYDWNDISTVDFDREWWIQSANEAFSVGGKRYVAVGDLSITTLLLSYAVFFNQRVAEEQQMPNLYELVLDGDWTIDKLIELSKDLYQDINNNGKPDDGDFYGFAGDLSTNLNAWPSAFNIPLIKLDNNGQPAVAMDIDRMQTGVEKIYSLYYDSVSFTGYGEEIDLFGNGNSAFVTTWINNAFTSFRDMKDDYGILPYPKLDDKQENYYSDAMDNYSLLSIPKTVKVEDKEFVGTITEALTRENHFSVVPAYYDVALSSKYARDEQSVAMLDIIMNNRQYDFSILHGNDINKFPYLFRDLIVGKSTAVASKWASMEESVKSGLSKLVEQYGELEN
ncbi:MAG: carbohydrate ABC transporter substrate-binding protein [Clostridiales bacterium]|nr:carbohydrate ABC transporter substrate-binding protein [Clostridiales bacterium]